MKLVRYVAEGETFVGLMDGAGQLRRCKSIEELNGTGWTMAQIADLSINDQQSFPLETRDCQLSHPVGRPAQIVSAPLNGLGRAEALGFSEQSDPHLFLRSPLTLAGDDDVAPRLRSPGRYDVGLVLGCLMGETLDHGSEHDAMDAMIGFVMGIEILDVDLQTANPVWNASRGGNLPRSIRLCPVLLTKDEIVDPRQLSLWLDIDHRRYQEMALDSLEFSPLLLMSYISSCFPLNPGDLVLSSGPPASSGRHNSHGLLPHQRLSFGCHGIGESHLTVAAE